MEELQASRDCWENQANNSEYEIQSLKQAVRAPQFISYVQVAQ